MVVSWLVHSVSPSIRQSILWMDQADDIWKDLKTRYSQENFRLDPTCTCTIKCVCSILTIIAQRKLEDQAMQFLRGLNDQYNNVKSHVLLMEPLPPISKIFSYVVQQERQLLGQNFIANVHLDRTSSVNVVASPTCTHCNRTGHTDAVCFRKHGFPSTINRSNRGSSNRPQRICNHCGKTGHTIEVCYQKHGLPPGSKPLSDKTASVNHTVTGDCKVTKSTQSLESQDVRFTPQQYQALLALIQQS
uniref:CCHC-type domain-containing protein n=1 Tax=Cajanus cajan TaxID=3821 RepID=A0A151T2P3_CAJCA|nr:hypothetical protein KK1_023728 [Cajanus cajan]